MLGSGIKWDEDNLHLTSIDRGTRTKITEPKTPYLHYDHESDRYLDHRSTEDMAHLPELNLEAVNQKLEEAQEKYGRRVSVAGSSSEGGGHKHRYAESEWRSDSGKEDDDDEAKHDDEFAKKRLNHYHMGEALKLGKQLIESEDDLAIPPPTTKTQ
jgi:hypothetical protein